MFYPILNNKIIVRVWHYTGAVTRNVFIANVPEYPEISDLFNLTQLRDNDGKMPARWMNLYGTPPLERSDRTKSRREGSAYLGRVLMGLVMLSNERPQFKKEPAPNITDPKTRLYKLWVELYDIVRVAVIPEGSKVIAKVSIATHDSKEVEFKYKAAKDLYSYKLKEVPEMLGNKEEGIELPHDLSQVPDIFVNFYVKNGNEK